MTGLNRRVVKALCAAALCVFFGPGCFVNSICFNDSDCSSDKFCLADECVPFCKSDADCDAGEYCDIQAGRCREAECFSDADCEEKFECRDHFCVPKGGLQCPSDMVSVQDRFCMDIYEASRPDATASFVGTDESHATSRAGVLPWFSSTLDLSVARSACESAGKRLCALDAWVYACRGLGDTDYCYGDEYDPMICNGIDTFCLCGAGSACEDIDPCPFPHCYDTCSADFHVAPTGSFPDCVNSWGVFDVCGNVWELTDSDDGLEHFRGGAFNCKDSENLQRCDHDGTWGPTARGFRCCKGE